MVDSADLEYALCHSTCFIKNNNLRLGKCLQIVGAFYQNTCVARTADSGKEAQRNTDDQRARTADYQEGQRTVDPLSPLRRIVEEKKIYNRRQ